MKKPRNFSFSQMKLQDYSDCERRFELKYLQQQAWPALRSEPVILIEKQMQLGKQFHLLAQQLFSGIPERDIEAQIGDVILLEWWRNFLSFARLLLENKHYPEFKISAQIGNFPFIAIYDLLVIAGENKFTVFDWKTSQHKPSRSQLSDAIQTRLYPLLLVQSGKNINQGAKIKPESIEMVYWFSNHPEEPEIYTYSENQYEVDLEYITELVTEISQKDENGFKKTEYIRRCKFCQYRSFCERGEQAGSFELESEEPWAEEIQDLDIIQIGEIEF